MKKTLSIIAIGVAAASLTGCKSLYGKYERPSVVAGGIVRDTLSAADTLAVADTASLGALPWEEVFTDQHLAGLIRQGLDRNADLANAALNVQVAEAQLKAARLAFLPSVAFAPTGTLSSWDGGKATKTYQLPIAASWTVDLFGSLTSQKRASQAALLAMRDYRMAVQANVVAGIANMYYTLLMLDKQLGILTSMEKLTKETWDVMLAQKDLSRGIRSTAVQSAEASYYSVKAQKVDMERQIRETENALSLLIMQPAGAIARGSLDDQSLPENLSTGVSVGLLAARPDVHHAEMVLAQCFYGIETARSRFYPSLTITPTAMFTNSAGGAEVNPGKWLLSAVASLAQPIFQNGRLKAGLVAAKAQYEQAYNSWQNSVFKAGAEVSNALVQYNSAREKSLIEQKRIGILERNVEDTRMLLQTAGSTYLEVITAEQALLNARLSKTAEDFYKMQAVVSLYTALGGGTK